MDLQAHNPHGVRLPALAAPIRSVAGWPQEESWPSTSSDDRVIIAPGSVIVTGRAPDNAQLWILSIDAHRPGGSGQSSVRITALQRGPTSVEKMIISTSGATSVYFRREQHPHAPYDFYLNLTITKPSGSDACIAPQSGALAPERVHFKLGRCPDAENYLQAAVAAQKKWETMDARFQALRAAMCWRPDVAYKPLPGSAMALLVAEKHLLGLIREHDANVDGELVGRFEWLSSRVPSPEDWYVMRAEQPIPGHPPGSATPKNVAWLTEQVHRKLDRAVVIQLPTEWAAKASAVQGQPQQQPSQDPAKRRRT